MAPNVNSGIQVNGKDKTMKCGSSIATLLLAVAATAVSLGSAPGPRKSSAAEAKPAIVLVHGAFADGSSWSKVIPLLEKDDYTVTAVQNPLTSIADDIATTKRVIDAQKGPIVVVGHSYGGAVITGAAAGNPNVKALIYVNAFAPDEGEKLTPMRFLPRPVSACARCRSMPPC